VNDSRDCGADEPYYSGRTRHSHHGLSATAIYSQALCPELGPLANASQVFGDGSELPQGSSPFWTRVFEGLVDAMTDVVVNQGFFWRYRLRSRLPGSVEQAQDTAVPPRSCR
jgi:hypothetical protein